MGYHSVDHNRTEYTLNCSIHVNGVGVKSQPCRLESHAVKKEFKCILGIQIGTGYIL